MRSLRIARIILLLSLIVFLYSFWTVDKTNCDVCSYEVEGHNVSANKFLEIYFSDCIFKEELDYYNINLGNISYGG